MQRRRHSSANAWFSYAGSGNRVYHMVDEPSCGPRSFSGSLRDALTPCSEISYLRSVSSCFWSVAGLPRSNRIKTSPPCFLVFFPQPCNSLAANHLYLLSCHLSRRRLVLPQPSMPVVSLCLTKSHSLFLVPLLTKSNESRTPIWQNTSGNCFVGVNLRGTMPIDHFSP